MKLKCVIVDDEPIARKVLQEYIEEIDFLELAGQAENPLKAMSILNMQDVDILLLDINMPKINGIDFLKEFKKQGERDHHDGVCGLCGGIIWVGCAGLSCEADRVRPIPEGLQ